MVQKGFSLNKGYAPFLLPGVLTFLFIIIIPFLVNTYLSFTQWQGVGMPTWVGLANYQKALRDVAFWASFKNNLSLIVAMVIIPTVLGLFLAAFLFDYIATKFGQRVSSFFRAGYYLPQIIPVVVAAVVWRWVLQPDWGVLNWMLTSIGLEGLTRNWLGNAATALPSVMAVMVWFQLGYPLVIFMAGLQRIDPELYEASSLDGASWFQRFRHITIPLLRPEIYVVVLTTTIAALKVFAPIYAMTRGGPGTATMVASYFSYKYFFESANVGYGATMATVLTLLVIVITIVYIRIQRQQEQRENP
ncbi:MAG: sugar ABC transporter permease [Anaerolineae bacterium]|nr:sugar ABC transporter permease [Anaerolineae bacterium]